MEKIRQIFAWFQIIIGTIGFIFYGGTALLDVLFGLGHGFVALYGLVFYIPVSLWVLISGILLLREKLIGKIMSVLTAAFLGFYIFQLFLRPILLLPSKTTQDNLVENIRNIPSVYEVDKYYLSGMDTFALHLFCDEKALHGDKFIEKTTNEVLTLIKKTCPKAKNYSSVRIIIRSYTPDKSKGLRKGWADIEFVWDKSVQDFVRNPLAKKIISRDPT